MSTTPHFSKRLALAEGALAIIRQLSPPGKGIPPYLNHRLLTGLLFPILTYGADLFVPTAFTLKKMTVLWNKALRWCTNLFSSTPTSILPCEACILPLEIALFRKRQLAALRIACSSPLINPASARMSTRFPSASSYRSPDSSRLHIPRGSGAYNPRSWNLAPTGKPGGSTHLPIDSLLHTIEFLHQQPTRFPELPIPFSQPKDPPMGPPLFPQLKKAITLLALHEWSLIPTPSYYTPTYYTSPHPFMGLNRFASGRIHQMRSGKSYLAAHPSWHSKDLPDTCPRCDEAPETMSHAILHCPATASLRLKHMPSVRSISPLDPLWSSTPLLLQLADFVQAARINYPPTFSKRYPHGHPPASSPSSPGSSPPPSPRLARATPQSPSSSDEDI